MIPLIIGKIIESEYDKQNKKTTTRVVDESEIPPLIKDKIDDNANIRRDKVYKK